MVVVGAHCATRSAKVPYEFHQTIHIGCLLHLPRDEAFPRSLTAKLLPPIEV